MALEWLKTILGDKYTPEIDTAVSQEIGKGFVSRTDFNATSGKLKEAEAQVTQLTESVKTRDSQLEELKKSAGASEELATVKLMAAVDAELTAAGAKNVTAVRAVLADFLKDAKIVDGKVTSKDSTGTVTLAAKVEALKKDASTDFLFGAAPKYNGWKPGEGGDGGGKPAGGKKPSEMSYSELADYLAANPDAKLDE